MARFEIVRYIKSYAKLHGYPPSMREISDEIGVSLTSVHYHLRVLKETGIIEHTPGVARGLRVKT